jgi:hypothetical protein
MRTQEPARCSWSRTCAGRGSPQTRGQSGRLPAPAAARRRLASSRPTPPWQGWARGDARALSPSPTAPAAATAAGQHEGRQDQQQRGRARRAAAGRRRRRLQLDGLRHQHQLQALHQPPALRLAQPAQQGRCWPPPPPPRSAQRAGLRPTRWPRQRAPLLQPSGAASRLTRWVEWSASAGGRRRAQRPAGCQAARAGWPRERHPPQTSPTRRRSA